MFSKEQYIYIVSKSLTTKCLPIIKGGKQSTFIVEKSSRQQHVNQVIKVNFSRNGTNGSPALSGRIQSEAHSIPESNCNETADKESGAPSG